MLGAPGVASGPYVALTSEEVKASGLLVRLVSRSVTATPGPRTSPTPLPPIVTALALTRLTWTPPLMGVPDASGTGGIVERVTDGTVARPLVRDAELSSFGADEEEDGDVAPDDPGAAGEPDIVVVVA